MAFNETSAAAELAAVRGLLHNVKPEEAEQRLRTLVSGIDDNTLTLLLSPLQEVVDLFFPKRRRELVAFLNQRRSVMGNAPIPEHDNTIVAGKGVVLQQELSHRLNDLADHHIFQWATAYRDTVQWSYSRATESLRDGLLLSDVEAVFRIQFRRHSKEIFERGHNYVSSTNGPESASIKSLNGLQRFIDLLIEAYSLLLVDMRAHEARVQRALASVLVGSIIEGYSLANLGTFTGGHLLTRYPGLWGHALGFLKKRELDLVLQRLPAGDLRTALGQSVLPVIEAIDKIADASGFSPFGMPRLVVWSEAPRRLEIKLDLPPSAIGRQYITLLIYLLAGSGAQRTSDQLTQRGQVIAVGPFGFGIHPPDGTLKAEEYAIVDTARSGADSVQAAHLLFDYIHQQLSDAAGKRAGSLLTYNIARDFPLKNPRLQRYFHVHRASVQRLIRGFEGKSGVRLWCSVRRSGKTTACFDLATTTASEVVVKQTCENTEVYPGAGRFYELFENALSDGARISPTFVKDAIRACASEEVRADTRVVFVLDEYESLFKRMRDLLVANPEKRYAVVQPILNQLAGFARDNLLILIGQRPDAHFIMMDQNQLSPYVEQDTFPLFEHQLGSLQSEFQLLLNMILGERVAFTPSFADAVHVETGGHPYLTVNLMVHFIDWMITNRKPRNPVELKAIDFQSFSETQLLPATLSLRPEYEFFLGAVGEGLGRLCRRDAPWLHAVHLVIRQIGLDGATSLLAMEKVDRSIAALTDSGELMITRNVFLRMAQLANFFSLRDGRVGAKIPLLARLCAAAAPPIAL